MKIKNITNDTSKTYTIQYGDSWFNDYLVYTEWLDDRGKVIDWLLVDQDNNIVKDINIIESVYEYVDNLEQ